VLLANTLKVEGRPFLWRPSGKMLLNICPMRYPSMTNFQALSLVPNL
jgi:hypothetical protein